ncbi:MAG: hypothetical protein RI996_137 [Candidatus Parcubacteria bacterium]|jgi:hypothetical protein
MNIQKVIFPSRPQIDTICAFYILQKYGMSHFIGIESAYISVSPMTHSLKSGEYLDSSGVLYLDCNQSIFDHHIKENTCLTDLVIDHLGLQHNAELDKIKAFAKRDDLQGKGIISQDKLDKAFGLPGLLTNLNKSSRYTAHDIFHIILPLLEAHVEEEKKRIYDMPEEIKRKSLTSEFVPFSCEQKGKKLSCCMIYSDTTSIGGYLRSSLGGYYDVVIQVKSSGHITILTRPLHKISLRGLILLIRLEELASKNKNIEIGTEQLLAAGTIESVPEWYYDTATNSLFNGGSSTAVAPTTINTEQLIEIVRMGISEKMLG